ncbi:MAG: HAMP domain-containing protein [Oligoflexales bacterium]|nr:HAMP domain-containing protein [Oligoflexales bacterium]
MSRIFKTISRQVGLKLAVSVVTMTMLVLMISGIIQYRVSSGRLKKALNEQLGQIADRMQGSVAEPLWNMSDEVLKNIIMSEMLEKNVVKVAITEENKKKPLLIYGLDEKMKPSSLKTMPTSFTDEIISTTRAVKRFDKAIGSIEIGVTTKYLNSQLNELVISNILTFAAICALIIAVFVLSNERLFIRHLHAILKQIEIITKGDLSKTMTITTSDEFADIAGSINNMTKSLKEKSNFAASIASGDLSQNLALSSDADTLGIALLKMKDSLGVLLGRISNSSEDVNSSSDTISDNSRSLSESTSSSAASIEQISSSLAEVSKKAKDNTSYVQEVVNAAKNMKSKMDIGNTQMQKMKAAIENIAQSSNKIAKIIKAIDNIAFQTNLLALNAAVEAARAGIHGKGFAVVAEEVRSLSSRSAKAAKETEELISESISRINGGSEAVMHTLATFSGIIDEVDKVTAFVDQIAHASKSQTEGISQINVAINHINGTIQQNASLAKLSASAAEQLEQQSQQLRQLMGQFRGLSASGDYFS